MYTPAHAFDGAGIWYCCCCCSRGSLSLSDFQISRNPIITTLVCATSSDTLNHPPFVLPWCTQQTWCCSCTSHMIRHVQRCPVLLTTKRKELLLNWLWYLIVTYYYWVLWVSIICFFFLCLCFYLCLVLLVSGCAIWILIMLLVPASVRCLLPANQSMTLYLGACTVPVVQYTLANWGNHLSKVGFIMLLE